MKKMRQVADRGLSGLKQVTPDVCRETNIAPAAFNLNQNNAVCLPLVSDGQKLIWVHSNQIDLQFEGVADLDKAFDRFPYLTEKQTAALAQRCSLHPDQVKVWFMLQRLRYGISWDYKDIQEVRRKVRPNQGKEKLQHRMGEETNKDRGKLRQKTEVDESAGKKEGKVKEEPSRNEGRMMGENVTANEQLERKMKQEQPVEQVKDGKDDEIDEDKSNTQQKRKRITVTDKMGKKRMKQVDEVAVKRAGEVDIRRDQERKQQKSTQSVTTICARKKKKAKANKRLMSIQQWPPDKSFVVSDEPLDGSHLLFHQPQTKALNVPPLSDNLTELLRRVDVFPTTSNCHGKPEIEARLEDELHVDLTNHSIFITDVDKVKELIEGNNPDVAEGSSIFTRQQHSHVVQPCNLPSQIRCTAKTRTQLEMMKVAFCHCQYPDSEDYDRLAMVIGIPRYVLVQWFGDMRYYIKKGRPRWMTQEQHSQALAKIRYRQCLKALAKV